MDITFNYIFYIIITMEIEIEKLDDLIQRADEIFFSREAEKIMIEFYKLKTKVEEAEKLIKQKLMDTGLKLSPHFKSIKGEHVKVNYIPSGAKYQIDLSKIDNIPKELINIKYLPNSKEIDAYKKSFNSFPDGISERSRKKKISVYIKKEDAKSKEYQNNPEA